MFARWRKNTIGEVCLSFVQHKKESGELSDQTIKEYEHVASVITRLFGSSTSLTYEQLHELRIVLGHGKKGQQLSPISHKRWIIHSRMLLKHARRMGVDVAEYSEALRTPSAKLLRRSLNRTKMFTPEQVRLLVERSDPEMRVIHLLGICAAYTPIDVVTLKQEAINGEWLEHPRPKTEVQRICWLFPELQESLADYPKLFGHLERHAIATAHRHISKACGVYQPGVTFSALRRTWLTWASASGCPQFVLDAVMGHVPLGVQGVHYRAKVYRQSIREVCEFVRRVYLGELTLE